MRRALRTRSMDYLMDRSTDPFYGPPLRTTPQNRRNVEVCEIVDSDEVSWIPSNSRHDEGMIPYDPAESRLPIRLFPYVWIKFELHSNKCLEERGEHQTKRIKVINIHDLTGHSWLSRVFFREAWGRVCDRERRTLSRTKWGRRNSTQILRKWNSRSSKYTGLSWSFIHRQSELCN